MPATGAAYPGADVVRSRLPTRAPASLHRPSPPRRPAAGAASAAGGLQQALTEHLRHARPSSRSWTAWARRSTGWPSSPSRPYAGASRHAHLPLPRGQVGPAAAHRPRALPRRGAYRDHQRQPHVERFVNERQAMVLATNIIELNVNAAKVVPLPTAMY